MLTGDTIVGLGTPPGAAGIAVVRLSGPDVLALGARLVPALARRPPARRLRLCRLVDPEGGELLDQALVCYLAGPRSYTGEDVLELQTHGGPATVAAVLAACVRVGARPARPGEFTLRAFLNGRMDLAEAEAVGALVAAQSERARRVALRQLAGGLSAPVAALRQRGVEILAEVEARLDFPEEDLAAFDATTLVPRLDEVIRELDDLLAQAPAGRLAREGARVVLVGRPNVGKSSLLNALVGRPRAIVQPTPGTTRDWLEDELSGDGVRLTLVDTAGQHSAGDEAEAAGARAGLEQARQADLALVVLDAAAGITPQDEPLLRQLDNAAVVINQRDRVDEDTCARLAARCESVLACTSAKTGAGVPELREALRQRFGGGESSFEELPLLSEQRHLDALRRARRHLEQARQGLADGLAEELVALELREATAALSAITGEGVTEDVLEAIFSRFCIGK